MLDESHHAPASLFLIRITSPSEPDKVIGYAMAEQIDFVPYRDDLLGVSKEALEAAEQTFERATCVFDAVEQPGAKPRGVKMFALLGSGNNAA